MSTEAAYLMYLLFGLGGTGLYLLMPKTGRPQGGIGAAIGLLAVIGLLLVLGWKVMTGGAQAGYFHLFAAIAMIAAARVVTHPRPVYAAMYFVVVVVATAALLVLQSAEFLAVALIIIYAGAILVTYLFVIMLAQQSGSPVYDRRSREPFASILMGFLLMAAVAGRIGELPPREAPAATRTQISESLPNGPSTAAVAGNSYAVGVMVMTRHVAALQLAGVLLLVSMVGAIALSRKRVGSEIAEAPGRPLGQIGKEVPPF